MIVFLALIVKLLPLYVIVFLGYLAGKYLAVKKESIAALLIYILSPVVIFNGIITTSITPALLSLPVLFFALACLMAGLFYLIGRSIWPGSEKNILSFTAGTGNTGYFGLPVALALFGDQFLGVAVLTALGCTLYESSVGFYVTARGHHTAGEAFWKVIKLPALYAFFVGLIFNLYHLPVSPIIMDALASFRGAYIVLGMMLVGLGLSQVTRASLDYLFTGICFLAKFVAWPVVIGAIIFLDKSFWHWYDPSTHKIMMLLSIVPLAAVTVAYATRLNTHPEKVAVTVLASTLFALIYIPLFVAVIFPLI